MAPRTKDNLVSGLLSLTALAVLMIAGGWLLHELFVYPIIIVNDTNEPLTLTILHDDADNANNKSLTQPTLVNPGTETSMNIYGGTYCIYRIEGTTSTRSFALKGAMETRPRYSTVISKMFDVFAGVVRLSKLTKPCEFGFDFPYDPE